MSKIVGLAVATVVAASLLSGPVFAQGAPQTVTLVKVDVRSLATGYRASKVVGSKVVNESNQTVGKIDDLIVTPDNRVPFAVLSVGGFLGVGKHLIVVPFDSLKVGNGKMQLPGATKDALKNLPEFKYASR